MTGFEGLLTGRTLLDRYRIDEVIGRGGFAAVYRGFDERLERTVAVKVIALSAFDSRDAEEVQKRFHREARAVARMKHPNVVAVYDFGTDPALGLDFLVMELLEGEDLSERLARADPIGIDAAARILHDAALGVNEGHRVGLIHRDVKPRNIFLARDEHAEGVRVCVLDFGIARFVAADDGTQLTRSGATPLSPPYASPEQLRGEQDLTPASDVFSLGVIGYQMLAGERPFPGDRLQDRDAAVEPLPLQQLNGEVSDPLAAVIHRALAGAPGERYADAGLFAQALSAAAGDRRKPRPPSIVPQAIRPISPEDPTVRVPAAEGNRMPNPALERDASGGAHRSVPPARPGPVQRPRAGRAGALAALMLLVVVAVGLAWWTMSADREPARASERGSQGVESPQVAERPQPSGPEDPDERAAGPSAPVASSDDGAARSPSVQVDPDPLELQGTGPRPAAPTGAPAAAGPTPRVGSAPAPAAGANASASALNQEGEQLFARGDFAGAVDRFRGAVQAEPGNPLYRNNLGWALFQLRDYVQAASELEEAARRDPRRAIVHANIGEVRWARGDKAGAIEAYQRFLQFDITQRQRQIAEEKLRQMRASDPPSGS
jgi:eukaryotic-like serine/threonine-protein kinase